MVVYYDGSKVVLLTRDNSKDKWMLHGC